MHIVLQSQGENGYDCAEYPIPPIAVSFPPFQAALPADYRRPRAAPSYLGRLENPEVPEASCIVDPETEDNATAPTNPGGPESCSSNNLVHSDEVNDQ